MKIKSRLLTILACLACWLYSSNITAPAGAVLEGNFFQTSATASSTKYYELYAATSNTTADLRNQMPIPRAGILCNLYFVTTNTQPASGSLVVTLNVNGSNTPITTTIAAGGAAAVYSDTTHTFAIAQGDLLTVQIVNNATTGSAIFQDISMLLR